MTGTHNLAQRNTSSRHATLLANLLPHFLILIWLT